MKRDQRLVSHFIEAWNNNLGHSYKIDRWPEEENRATPTVEAIAVAGSGETLAIEHTLIEPFEGKRLDDDRLQKVFVPLENFPDLKKVGFNVDIVVQVGAIPKGIKWQDWPMVTQRLHEYLVPKICAASEGQTTHPVDGLPFALSVTLGITKHDPSEPDHVWVSRFMPADTLKQIVARALARKLPKLVGEQSTRKLLLLEQDDYAHGHSDIRVVIDELSHQFEELKSLDEIWLAITPGWETEKVIFFYELFPTLGDRRFKHNV